MEMERAADMAERRSALEDYNQQLGYEQELEKIRTEGDVALVRAQAERQQIAEADAKLKELQRHLKEKKKQFARLSVNAGSGIVGDSATLEQLSRRHESARAQLEERLKAAVSAKTTELLKLREQIDEQRRLRLDGLNSEKRIVEETKRAEEMIKQSQSEVEGLKEKASTLRNEIAQLELEFDNEKSAFRLERQHLQLELDRIARPERVAVKVKVLGRKFTVFRSVAMTRKKRDAISRAKKLSLEQKFVSFEQKKVLMDRLVQESGVATLNEFIELYNQQEEEKAEIMARIEAKSFTNASLKDVVAQLEEDITRLSGAGDIQAIVHMEEPSELRKKIDKDEGLIRQWSAESHAFQEALKTFRDPIRELFIELFPHEREHESFDTTINEVTMLQRIGAIEERVMQRVLMKILRETSESNNSETLKRLQKYRGTLGCKDGRDIPKDQFSPRKAVPPLVIDAPSVRDVSRGNDSDDDDDEDLEVALAVVRSGEVRSKPSDVAAHSPS